MPCDSLEQFESLGLWKGIGIGPGGCGLTQRLEYGVARSIEGIIVTSGDFYICTYSAGLGLSLEWEVAWDGC